MSGKQCTKCGQVWPRSFYNLNDSRTGRLKSYCKACQRASDRAYKQNRKQAGGRVGLGRPRPGVASELRAFAKAHGGWFTLEEIEQALPYSRTAIRDGLRTLHYKGQMDLDLMDAPNNQRRSLYRTPSEGFRASEIGWMFGFVRCEMRA